MGRYLIAAFAVLIVIAGCHGMHTSAIEARDKLVAEQRDQVWADAFANYTQQIDKTISELNSKLQGADLLSQKKIEWLTTQLTETNNALEQARKARPLSTACSQCSVPAERVQRRPFTTTVVPAPDGGKLVPADGHKPDASGAPQGGGVPAQSKALP